MCKKGESTTNIANFFTKTNQHDGFRARNSTQSNESVGFVEFRRLTSWEKKLNMRLSRGKMSRFRQKARLKHLIAVFTVKHVFIKNQNRIMPGYVRHHFILKYYGVLNHSNIFNVHFYKRISLFFLLQVSVQFYFNFKCKKLNIIQFKPLKMYNV